MFGQLEHGLGHELALHVSDRRENDQTSSGTVYFLAWIPRSWLIPRRELDIPRGVLLRSVFLW